MVACDSIANVTILASAAESSISISTDGVGGAVVFRLTFVDVFACTAVAPELVGVPRGAAHAKAVFASCSRRTRTRAAIGRAADKSITDISVFTAADLVICTACGMMMAVVAGIVLLALMTVSDITGFAGTCVTTVTTVGSARGMCVAGIPGTWVDRLAVHPVTGVPSVAFTDARFDSISGDHLCSCIFTTGLVRTGVDNLLADESVPFVTSIAVAVVVGFGHNIAIRSTLGVFVTIILRARFNWSAFKAISVVSSVAFTDVVVAISLQL